MKLLLTFAKIMLWCLEFEISFTPCNAIHYGQLKTNRMYWQGQVQRYSLNSHGIKNDQH